MQSPPTSGTQLLPASRSGVKNFTVHGRFLAGAKKETMPRRRLHGKQSSQNYLVPASRVVEEQRPQVGAAGSPYLKAIFEDAGASLEAAWWDVDYVALQLLPHATFGTWTELCHGQMHRLVFDLVHNNHPYVFLMTGNGGIVQVGFHGQPTRPRGGLLPILCVAGHPL